MWSIYMLIAVSGRQVRAYIYLLITPRGLMLFTDMVKTVLYIQVSQCYCTFSYLTSVDLHPALATAGLSAGAVVGISITIFLMSSAISLLAALTTYCCMKSRGKSVEQPHISPSEGVQIVPVYDEVVAGPVNELHLKQNPSYEAGTGKMKMKQNPSYGPVGH